MRHSLLGAFLFFCCSNHSVAETLADRYAKNACAVVRIETTNSVGTGFFANTDGLLVTAAHVIFDRSFTRQGQQIALQLNEKGPIALLFHDGTRRPIPPPRKEQRDIENAVYDLVAIETGLKSTCAIPIGKSDALRIGDRLIAIGFPGSANSGVLYEGFLSSKDTRVPTTIGQVQNPPQMIHLVRDILRIQMPITAGASGSPVISESDEAIGIVSEIPVQWTAELSRLVQAMQNGQGSGITLNGFDTTKILADLALIVREFESPGAGLAVPTSYLKLPQATQSPKL
jgi:hypothetical protein